MDNCTKDGKQMLFDKVWIGERDITFNMPKTKTKIYYITDLKDQNMYPLQKTLSVESCLKCF